LLDRIGTGENHTYVTLDLLQYATDADGDKLTLIITQQPELGTLQKLSDDGRHAMYRYTVKENASAAGGWDKAKFTVK
jgi:hypothetical protein